MKSGLLLFFMCLGSMAQADVSFDTPKNKIARGNDFFCSIFQRELHCFGKGLNESLVPPADLGPVDMVTAGEDFICTVFNNHIRCWGAGYEDGENQILPPQDLGPITQIVAGAFHACALASGRVHCWGSDRARQLAIASLNLEGVREISAGWVFSCALTSDRVYCRGGSRQQFDFRFPPGLQNLHGLVSEGDHVCVLSGTTPLCTPRIFQEPDQFGYDPRSENMDKLFLGSKYQCWISQGKTICNREGANVVPLVVWPKGLENFSEMVIGGSTACVRGTESTYCFDLETRAEVFRLSPARVSVEGLARFSSESPWNLSVQLTNTTQENQTFDLWVEDLREIFENLPEKRELVLGPGEVWKTELNLKAKAGTSTGLASLFFFGAKAGDLKIPHFMEAGFVAPFKPNGGVEDLFVTGDFSNSKSLALFNLRSEKLDVWDTSISGPNLSEGLLKSYEGRLVHVAADPSLQLSQASYANLRDFIGRGGSVVFWARDLGSDSDFIRNLGEFLGITGKSQPTSVRSFNFNEYFTYNFSVVSRLKITQGESVNILESTSPRARPAFPCSPKPESPQQCHAGLISFHGEYSDLFIKTLILGFNADQVDKRDLKTLLAALPKKNESYSKRLELAATGERFGWESFEDLILDAFNEIRIDDMRGDINGFKESNAQSKFHNLTNQLFGIIDSAQQRAITKKLPAVYALVDELKDKKLKRAMQMDLLTRRYHVRGGVWNNKMTWPKFFCSDKDLAASFPKICS